MILAIGLLAGCSKELPPRSVNEFVDKPIMLEAAMVRCSQDRARTRYEAECINAREAVARIEAREEAKRKVEFEAQSDAKRRALRRAQEAAASARRRAAEAARLKQEAEYLAQFGVLPPVDGETTEDVDVGNTPIAFIPDVDSPVESTVDYGGLQPATDGGNAPIALPEPEPVPDPEQAAITDLDAVREELRRRAEEGIE